MCWDEWRYALAVQRGERHDPQLLPAIWAAQDDADWEDPDVWRACNPSVDSIFSMDQIEASFNRAQESPRKIAAFKQWRLCMWVESHLADWLSTHRWDACPTIADAPLGELFAGVDLGLTKDLTAASILAVEATAPLTISVRVRCWVSRDNFNSRVKFQTEPYAEWFRRGVLRIYEEEVLPFQYFIDELTEFLGTKSIRIGFDKWSAEFLMQSMEQKGFNVFDVRQRPQYLNAAVTEFERMVISGRISHEHEGMLRWALQHAVLKFDDAGCAMVSKKTKHKIDALTATINGLDVLLRSVRIASGAPVVRGSNAITKGLRGKEWGR